MPDRIVRDELLDSERFLSLPRNSHRLAFLCLILRADPFGNMEAHDGTLFRLWRDVLKLDDRQAVAEMLEALLEVDLVRLYDHESKRYLHIPRYRQRLKHLGSLLPLSPWTTLEQKQSLEKIKAAPVPPQGGPRAAEEKRSDVEVKRSEESKEKSKALSRAARLPQDWRLPEEWKDWAVKAYHLDPQKVVRISLAFRDYWIAKPKDAAKLDWLATWRNWIRKECENA